MCVRLLPFSVLLAGSAAWLPAQTTRDAYDAECPPPALGAPRAAQQAERETDSAAGRPPRIRIDGPGSFIPRVSSVFFDEYLVLPHVARKDLQAGLDSLAALGARPGGSRFLALGPGDDAAAAYGVCPGVGVLLFQPESGQWTPPTGIELPRRPRASRAPA